MGLFFFVLVGISAMIVVAWAAARATKKDRASLKSLNGKEQYSLDAQTKDNRYTLEVLVHLLIAKGVITKEELERQIKGPNKEKGEGD